MNFPGPNQTGAANRRRLSLPTERLFAQRRASPAQIFASGLQLERAACDAGYADGAAGRRWDHGSHDLLSYAAGYVAGVQFGRKRGG